MVFWSSWKSSWLADESNAETLKTFSSLENLDVVPPIAVNCSRTVSSAQPKPLDGCGRVAERIIPPQQAAYSA
jgi:hypothetical protein